MRVPPRGFPAPKDWNVHIVLSWPQNGRNLGGCGILALWEIGPGILESWRSLESWNLRAPHFFRLRQAIFACGGPFCQATPDLVLKVSSPAQQCSKVSSPALTFARQRGKFGQFGFGLCMFNTMDCDADSTKSSRCAKRLFEPNLEIRAK